jgi:hypothetical protein
MYETEVVEYRVDDRQVQTSYVQDGHAGVVALPPQASHVQIDFDLFDNQFLRARYVRQKSNAFAKEVVAHQFFRHQLGVYEAAVPRISYDSPLRKTPGMEPRAIMMDMLNLVNRLANNELKDSPNAPRFVTPIHYKYSWSSPDPLDGIPALLPCVGTWIDSNGVRDIDNWKNAVLFIDIRPEEGYLTGAHTEGQAPPIAEKHRASAEAAESSSAPKKNNGKRKRGESISTHASKRSKRGSTPTGGTSKPPRPLETKALPPIVESTSSHAKDGRAMEPLLVEDDRAMSRYANEAMSGLGNRRHMMAILVEGLTFRFWYFDHAGSIRTSRLHLLRDTEKIAAAIINLSLLTAEQLGLQPMSGPDPSIPKSMFRSVKGCEISVDGVRYEIHDVLHRDRDLYGRGTVIYSAYTKRASQSEQGKGKQIVLYDESVPDQVRAEIDREREEREARWERIPDTVTIKLSWRLVSSPSDDELFSIARERGADSVVTLYGARVAGRLSDGVRDALVSPEFYQDRVLRVQVFGPIYEPISSIADVPTLQKAFISCVQGAPNLSKKLWTSTYGALVYYELYSKIRILHRNMSPNSLMHDSSGRGVIVDLDHAVNLDGLQLVHGAKVAPPLPYPISGTPSFLAIDLLDLQAQGNTSSITYHYRYELESLFYSLAWISTHFHHGQLAWSTAFGDWLSGNSNAIAASKRSFLEACASESHQFVRSNDITLKWLPALAKLFRDAFAARDEAKRVGSGLDEETLGGRVTFEAFMGVLQSEGSMTALTKTDIESIA